MIFPTLLTSSTEGVRNSDWFIALLWLVGEITLVSVFRQTLGNHTVKRVWDLKKFVLSNYTIVSIPSASNFVRVEACFAWPLLLCSCLLDPPWDLWNKVSLRNDPFCISSLSVCRFSLAKFNNSLLCFCFKAFIRRIQLIRNMATIVDISDFSSALFLISSSRLGSIWSCLPASYSRMTTSSWKVLIKKNYLFCYHFFWFVPVSPIT